MSLRRSVALARYALAYNLRTPYTWVGAALLVGLTVLGLYSSAAKGEGWALDFSFLFNGAMLGAIFGIRSGLIPQRTGGLQTYLRANFMSPIEHATGAILSLLASWLGLCAATFLLALILPGGGLTEAFWYTMNVGLRFGLLLPFVFMTETVSSIELPFFLPGVAYIGLLMTLVLTIGEVRAIAILAPPIVPGSLGSARPLLARFAVVNIVGFAAVIGVTAARAQRRVERAAGNGSLSTSA